MPPVGPWAGTTIWTRGSRSHRSRLSIHAPSGLSAGTTGNGVFREIELRVKRPVERHAARAPLSLGERRATIALGERLIETGDLRLESADDLVLRRDEEVER